MKLKSYLIGIVLALSSQIALANPVDPCFHNQWIVSINQNNQATKEDILQTLRLFGTGGFSLNHVFNFEPIFFSLKFNPNYYLAPERAQEVKDATLKRLMEIPGNKIECDSIVSI